MSEELIEKLKINTNESSHAIVERYSTQIRSASNPLEKANIILAKFDVSPITDPDVARITAVSLILELAIEGKKFDIKKAEKNAAIRVNKVFQLFGRLVPQQEKTPKNSKQPADEQSQKVQKALEVYRKYHTKSVKFCTEKIAKALKIPYTSAYYYHRKFSKN